MTNEPPVDRNKAPCFGEEGFDVDAQEREWGQLPHSMRIVEFWGNGDPFFGGSADDRPVLISGKIREDDQSPWDCVTKKFNTLKEAQEWALKIPNRRPGSLLGVCPSWRR